MNTTPQIWQIFEKILCGTLTCNKNTLVFRREFDLIVRFNRVIFNNVAEYFFVTNCNCDCTIGYTEKKSRARTVPPLFLSKKGPKQLHPG